MTFTRTGFLALSALVICLSVGHRSRDIPPGCGIEEISSVHQSQWIPAGGDSGEDQGIKLVCLTFDDGPSSTTPQILRILKEEQVPATFFVIAAENNREYLPLIAQEVEEGHQIGLHTASHRYSQIYAGSQAFWLDIKQLRKAICHYVDLSAVNCIRFPGGSTNTVSRKYGGAQIMDQLKEEATEKGYHYIDWNVCAEDAVGGHPSAEEILANVKGDVGEKQTCVVLMHDTAATSTTAQALPAMIRWFREQGFQFCTVQEMLQIRNGV